MKWLNVVAKHAAVREDQTRQAALVTRVMTDMSDIRSGRACLAKSRLTLQLFRAQEFEPTASVLASQPARTSIPMARGAS